MTVFNGELFCIQYPAPACILAHFCGKKTGFRFAPDFPLLPPQPPI
jgi:hypothetical protein